jgi:hypothetical protein
MSHATDFVLSFSPRDNEGDLPLPPIVTAINQAVSAAEPDHEFRRIDQYAGGLVSIGTQLFAMGGRFMPVDAVVHAIVSQPWVLKNAVQLFVRDDPDIVFKCYSLRQLRRLVKTGRDMDHTT